MMRAVSVISLGISFGWALLVGGVSAAELRGAWIDRSSLVSREEIRATMRGLARANFNVAFVNAWSRGYPLWSSEVFRKETGILTDPGFGGRDVMREALEEATRAGIAMMPWVEYGFVGGYSGYYPGEGGRGPIFDRHPDWLAQTSSGETRFPAPGGFFFWMVQTRPEVQEFLLALMEELAQRYATAGIQFDRARYPALDCGYDPHTVELYRREHQGAAPPADPADAEWVRWRADKINEFVAALYQRLKKADVCGLVSNAPTTYPYGYANFAQDYPGWLRARSLDFVVPQIYRRDLASYVSELERQIAAVPDPTLLIPGIDSTQTTAEVLVQMIQATRCKGLRGVVAWYYRGLERTGAFEILKAGVFSKKARLPWRRPAACRSKRPAR